MTTTRTLAVLTALKDRGALTHIELEQRLNLRHLSRELSAMEQALSIPSRGLDRVAVTRIEVSPHSTSTEPPAWGAYRPVVSRISRPSKEID